MIHRSIYYNRRNGIDLNMKCCRLLSSCVQSGFLHEICEKRYGHYRLLSPYGTHIYNWPSTRGLHLFGGSLSNEEKTTIQIQLRINMRRGMLKEWLNTNYSRSIYQLPNWLGKSFDVRNVGHIGLMYNQIGYIHNFLKIASRNVYDCP